MASVAPKPKRGRPRASDTGLGASAVAKVRKTTRMPSSPQVADGDDELSRELDEGEPGAFSTRKRPADPPETEVRKKRGRPRRTEPEEPEDGAGEDPTPSKGVPTGKRSEQPRPEPTEQPPAKRAKRRSTGPGGSEPAEAPSARLATGRKGANKPEEIPGQQEPATEKVAAPAASADGARRSTRERRSAHEFPMWLGPNESYSFTASTPRDEPRHADSQPSLDLRPSLDESSIPKARGRPKSQKDAPAKEIVDDQPPQESVNGIKRKRGRPSKGGDDQSGEATRPANSSAAEPVPTQEPTRNPPTRGQPRRSAGSDAVDTAPPSKSRGRPPRKSDAPSQAADEPAPRQKVRPNRATQALEQEPEAGEDQESEDDSSDGGEADARRAKYRQLQSRVRNIPRSVVTDKWQALDEASIDLANNMLYDAFHPVLMRLQDRPQRYQQAHQALTTTAARIERKLRDGLPFPRASVRLGASGPRGGAGHEDELDYERPVKAIKALEGQLTALLDAEKLLSSTAEAEDAELEREYERLRELEKNARAEARTWRERGKRAHSLAPEPRPADEVERQARHGRLGLVNGESLAGGIFRGLEDKQLKDLGHQFSSHMTSMKSNLDQIEGVASQVMQSRGIVQQVLLQNLAPAEVDEALTGVKRIV
ncbi:hypothetical protein GQ53DRAFT_325552 [Thozetella sp. PMI_491]|nr:hypothetical protein GQ53DRAFT_325552 [Thozetella sp. PMI_491]